MNDNSMKFKIKNFGNTHYWPPENLQFGLEKILIFNENHIKKGIPNGSVFVYKKTDNYHPEILKSDVGCGITAFITGKLNFSKKGRQDILKAVDEIGIHIGQGNHFLDFSTPLPLLMEKRFPSNTIYLHSDFNNKNVVPGNYSQAKDLEKQAKEKRFNYLEKLVNLLGVSGNFYKDWTHNSVNKENDKIIYRKGAINLNETDGVGLLALNPVYGVYLYVGDFSDYEKSVQHGVGRIGSKGELFKELEKEKFGIARGYRVDFKKGVSHVKKIQTINDKIYNSMDSFRNNFWEEYSQIGVSVPELVVTTKKMNV